jgi:hypothetical protein
MKSTFDRTSRSGPKVSSDYIRKILVKQLSFVSSIYIVFVIFLTFLLGCF